LPLASTIADARRVVEAQERSDWQVFVDMCGRFDPATQLLHESITEQRYGALKTLDLKPQQRPYPRIWLGGAGDKLTLRVAAEHADAYNVIGSADDVARRPPSLISIALTSAATRCRSRDRFSRASTRRNPGRWSTPCTRT
jgi:alkanesulfonate monooxygenase SsuD/methylene tetrahydromethanopterin reductase-like flavin-dependent oxidoreductase (luciferase family)